MGLIVLVSERCPHLVLVLWPRLVVDVLVLELSDFQHCLFAKKQLMTCGWFFLGVLLETVGDALVLLLVDEWILSPEPC